MAKVTNIEIKQDKNGNNMKVTEFDNGNKVYVNAKYDSDVYDSVAVGAEFPLVQDGNFWKIDRPGNRSTGGSRKTYNVAAAQERKASSIQHAQDNKDYSIKVSSTARDATIITAELMRRDDTLDFKRTWQEVRQWLWENWDVDKQDIPDHIF